MFSFLFKALSSSLIEKTSLHSHIKVSSSGFKWFRERSPWSDKDKKPWWMFCVQFGSGWLWLCFLHSKIMNDSNFPQQIFTSADQNGTQKRFYAARQGDTLTFPNAITEWEWERKWKWENPREKCVWGWLWLSCITWKSTWGKETILQFLFVVMINGGVFISFLTYYHWIRELNACPCACIFISIQFVSMRVFCW